MGIITDVFFAVKDGKNVSINVDNIQDPAAKPFFFIRFILGPSCDNRYGHIITNLEEWYSINEDLYQSIFFYNAFNTDTNTATLNYPHKPTVINNISKIDKGRIVVAINAFMSKDL